MITWDSVVLIITPELGRMLKRKKKLLKAPGIQGMLEFPERFFRALSDPPETGRIAFGPVIELDIEDTSRFIRVFRASDEMKCYISESRYPNLYDVHIWLGGNKDMGIIPHTLLFLFNSHSPHPTRPPSV